MSETQIIEPATVVRRAETAVSAPIGDETAMMSLEKSMYYGLDDIGSRIWALIEQPRSVGDLCDTLMAEFEVDRETCQQHVLEFLEELKDEGIVTVLKKATA